MYYIEMYDLKKVKYSNAITHTYSICDSDLSKHFLIDCKGEVQHILNVIVLHPL